MTQFKRRILRNVRETITYLISLSKITHFDGMLNLDQNPASAIFFKIKFGKKN